MLKEKIEAKVSVSITALGKLLINNSTDSAFKTSNNNANAK
jgi:hypothetical protein